MKKILIGVGILLVIGAIIVSVAGYKVFQAVDEKMTEKEPEIRQYITMTVEEQNAYVEKNLEDFLDMAAKGSENAQDKEAYNKVKADPEAKAVGVEAGRAIIASWIVNSESLQADLNEELKAKFQKEADDLSNRMDKYSKVLEKYQGQK